MREIRRRAIQAGLKLVDCPIRHLGTEKAQTLYLALENYLRDNDVEMIFGWECEELLMDGETCLGVSLRRGDQTQEIRAQHTVVATGRRGADWLEKICAEHGIAHQPGTVDIGVRVECRNEVMEEVNRVLYESKLIGYPRPFKNKVRTFCQNPGGFVSQENYDNDLAVVNGHSYKDIKSDNTNVSVLCSHNFSLSLIHISGKVLETGVGYFTLPNHEAQKPRAKAQILGMIRRHGVTAIAIGNGTASRESEQFIAALLPEAPGVAYVIVSEAGASVYSASKLAAKEFPEYDVSLRSAVSIARCV